MLKSLIERGLDVNARNNYGVTPLMNAVVSAISLSKKTSEANQTRKIDMLLSREELDLNACERNGNTALMIACQCGDREVIRSILNDSRVNINQTNSGMSPS